MAKKRPVRTSTKNASRLYQYAVCGFLLSLAALLFSSDAFGKSNFFEDSVRQESDNKAQVQAIPYIFPAHAGETRSVHFTKALILSHPDAKDRRASIQRNFARYKLPRIDFVDAIDVTALKAGCHAVNDTRPGKPAGWKTFNKECMEKRMALGVDEKAADQMPHGHVALTATFVQAFRRVAQGEPLQDDEMVLFFEDDARVINMAQGSDLTTMHKVPVDAEVLDFGKGTGLQPYTAESGER
jgi:hypothetical protein